MIDHSDAEGLLADAAGGSLDPARAAELDAHVQVCEECRTWRTTYELLAQAATDRADGHPTSDGLARYAAVPAGLPVAERAAIEGHVATCETCRQDLVLVRAALIDARAHQPAGGPLARAHLLPLTLAASLLLAAVAGILYGQVRSLRSDLADLQRGPGLVEPVLIQDAQRSAGDLEWRVRRDQSFGLLAIRLEIPDGGGPTDLLVFEMRDERGGIRWTVTAPAGAARDHVQRDGAVFLQIPVHDLEPGRYTCVVRAGGAQAAPLLQRVLTLRRIE